VADLKSSFSTKEKISEYKDVTIYNNNYEFSSDKEGPAAPADLFQRGRRSDSLHLAGETRSAQADGVRIRAAPAAVVQGGSMAAVASFPQEEDLVSS
jgi:hypothetical protein